MWGFCVFAASLPLAGHVEPWDGLAGYYPAALFLGGLIAPFCVRARPSHVWMGLVVGQQTYVLFGSSRGAGNLWPIGLAFTMVASLLGPVGWWAGSWLARRRQLRP